MTFGDPKDFAIEAYHEPFGPEWGGYGRLCLHVQGVSIGDIRDNHCSLWAVTDRLRRFAGVIQDLWVEGFTGTPDADVFRLIDDAIYTDKATSELGSGFRAFGFLTNSAEMFDGTKTFIFCSPDGLVHILYRFRDDTFGFGYCRVQTFRNVIDAYTCWFDEQVRTTAPPFFPINPFDPNERVPDNRNG